MASLLSGAVATAADTPLPRQPRRPLDVAEGRVSGPRVELAERQVLGQLGLGDHVHGAWLELGVFGFIDDVRAQRQVKQPGGALQHLRVADDDDPVLFPKVLVGEGLGQDLRPDPRRVPHRHGYEGCCHWFSSCPRERLYCPYQCIRSSEAAGFGDDRVRPRPDQGSHGDPRLDLSF